MATFNRRQFIQLSGGAAAIAAFTGCRTDHRHGSVMLLLGGNVTGGQTHGQWPGLKPEQLVGQGDLAVTTDYRNLLGEVLAKRLNNPNLKEIFPGYQPVFRGVVRKE